LALLWRLTCAAVVCFELFWAFESPKSSLQRLT
jgi:hypothetical protein